MSPHDARSKAHHGPVRIPRLAIASPCTEAWEDMPGTDRVRHCGTCRQNVYNVSEMTVGQAIKLIREREGRVCIRMLLRRDGTVITQDCRARLRALRKRGFIGLAAFLLLFIPVTLGAQIFGWFTAERCLTGTPSGNVVGQMVPPDRVLMGEPVAVPPTTPEIGVKMGKVALPQDQEPQELMGDVL